MDDLTDKGRAAIEAAAARHGVSAEAARTLFDALVAGRGGQAQFRHPELGGLGQWSRGGMTMIGDMFNDALKGRVAALAAELAPLAEDPAAFAAGVPRGGGDWWPVGLGRPSAAGAQNDMRYAVFPAARRLAVDDGGRVAVYDTGEHLIGGVAQSQGGARGLAFSSQLGPVRLDALRRVDPDAPAATPAAEPPTPARDDPAAPAAGRSAPPAAGPVGSPPGDPLALIERMAELHRKGVLTEAEFVAKKAELLARL